MHGFNNGETLLLKCIKIFNPLLALACEATLFFLCLKLLRKLSKRSGRAQKEGEIKETKGELKIYKI